MEHGNYGKVTQVIGSTLDAHFAEDKLPGIYNALRVEVPLRQIFVAQTIERFAADLLDCPSPQREALQRTAELYVTLSRMSEAKVGLCVMTKTCIF